MFSDSGQPDGARSDGALEDARLLGLDLSPGDLARTLPQDAVWRGNVPALIAFLTAATQWNCVGIGDGRMQVIGLRYADTRAALDLAGIEVTPALWGDLRIIERGALGEMNGGGR